jgi:NAD(P)-dependent dehydrogenase (short-subunit alcohol dehydrogenase family)
LFGYINMCRSFYASMRERGGGVILNINGNGGEVQAADYVAGACANAAIMGLTRALGGSSHFDNIRVLAINPGATATERIVRIAKKAAADRLGDESRYQEILGSFAFERIATVEEIADMAAFLVSDLSAYTSGTIVTIDGGHVYNRKMF